MTDHVRAPAADRRWSERGRLPDFFVVGHPKCGTTAMYEMLRQHPQIFMSPIKEPRFFNDDLLVPNEIRMTLDEYIGLFSDAAEGQLLGEASPGYLISRAAARNIAEANPAAHIIAILRDPASLIRSMHLQSLRNGRERNANLRAALEASQSRPGWVPYDGYVKFVEQLDRYHAVFPREQILVLIYDDYRRSNVDVMQTVFRFLGVDEDFRISPTDINLSGVRSHRLATAWASMRDSTSPPYRLVRYAGRAMISRRVRDRLRRQYHRLNTAPPPPVDEVLMAELRERYAPEVRRLSDYLGRDLQALWGYPTA